MKYLLTLIHLLYFTISFAQKEREEKYDRIADSMYNKGKTAELVRYFEEELKVYPKDENVIRWLGHACLYDGQFERVEDYYLQALEINPKCAVCWANIALSYSGRGNIKASLECIEKAIAIDNEDAYLYYIRGQIREKLQDRTGAFMDFNKAVRLDPDNMDYYLQRCYFNTAAGYFHPALSDVNKALELSTEKAKPICLLGRSDLYYRCGKFPEALEDINAAIALSPNAGNFYFERGSIYNAMDSLDKTISDYLKAYALDSTDYRPLVNLVNLYYDKKHEADQACVYAQKVHGVLFRGGENGQLLKECEHTMEDICDPSKPSYYYQRAIGAFLLRKPEECIRLCNQTLEKFPGNFFAMNSKADSWFWMKEYAKAAAEYKSIVALNEKEIKLQYRTNNRFTDMPEDSLDFIIQGTKACWLMNAGQCELAMKKTEKAKPLFDSCIALMPEGMPEQYTPYQLRGTIYLMNGKYADALADFEKSVELGPKVAPNYVNRAIAAVGDATDFKLAQTGFIRKNLQDPVSVQWIFPAKLEVNRANPRFKQALEDCDRAVMIDRKYADAYYVRGQVKKMLGYDDYCTDLAKAKELGYDCDKNILKGCNR